MPGGQNKLLGESGNHWIYLLESSPVKYVRRRLADCEWGRQTFEILPETIQQPSSTDSVMEPDVGKEYSFKQSYRTPRPGQYPSKATSSEP
jgi:hypothetical protein